tara:strand:+ start:1965 stop:3227 length:1263 start_codon:yes stop_codon:yes gene_type:complete
MNNSPETKFMNIPVVIIGAGIAGLTTSYYLKKNNIDHIIIEKGEVANTWIKERWDSFYLVNPNWAIKIPEFGFGTKHFPSNNPDEFLSKKQTIKLLKSYSKFIGSEIYENEFVNSIKKDGSKYKITTSLREIISDKVVLANGAFGDPYIPEISSRINNNFYQIHSADYKNYRQLPEGGVLVVGSGQSGAQIAEDLLMEGKKVYLALSKCGRRLRRYRGKDSSWWNYKMGLFDKTVNDVPLENRWKCSPHTSGANGGHEINLIDLSEKGLNLLGSVKDCFDNKLIFNNDLYENLKFSDEFAINWTKNVDKFIKKNNLKVPYEKISKDTRIESFKIIHPLKINIKPSITSIIWSTGFRYNYDWIDFVITDENGFPDQKRGLTKHEGFYFMGLQWMYSSKSAQFIGVGEDAEYVVNELKSKIV